MMALLMLFQGDLLLKKSFYLSYCNKTDQEPTSKELSFSVVVDVGGVPMLLRPRRRRHHHKAHPARLSLWNFQMQKFYFVYEFLSFQC